MDILCPFRNHFPTRYIFYDCLTNRNTFAFQLNRIITFHIYCYFSRKYSYYLTYFFLNCCHYHLIKYLYQNRGLIYRYNGISARHAKCVLLTLCVTLIVYCVVLSIINKVSSTSHSSTYIYIL